MKVGFKKHLRLLAVARGESVPDLLLKGGTIANVYFTPLGVLDVKSGEILPASEPVT